MNSSPRKRWVFGLSILLSLLLFTSILSSCGDGGTASRVSEEFIASEIEQSSTSEDQVKSAVNSPEPSPIPLAGRQHDVGTKESVDRVWCGSGSNIVQSPNGGEHWRKGNTYKIKWSSANSYGPFVHILLYYPTASCEQCSCLYKFIAKSTWNTGYYNWKIPTTIQSRSDYIVLIGPGLAPWAKLFPKYDWSNKVFKISRSKIGAMKVTTPNGGQKWRTGKRYALKWDKGNGGASVKIQLLRSGRHYKWISKRTKNDGRFTWKIPSSVATGSAYKIKITSRTKKTVTDTSNKNFKITRVGGKTTTTTSIAN